MQLPLKDVNRPTLMLVVVANVAGYYAILVSDFNLASFTQLLSEYREYIPSAIVGVAVGVLNAQLDHVTKARLVFWRWRHPLPGSYAFSHGMETDSRIDPSALRAHQDPLPSSPAKQNRLWYKWYLAHKEEPAVKQVHREYLFTRDWTGLVILLVVPMTVLAIWQMDLTYAILYLFAMIAQYLLVKRAARHHGERFVATVLAHKSAAMG